MTLESRAREACKIFTLKTMSGQTKFAFFLSSDDYDYDVITQSLQAECRGEEGGGGGVTS